MKQDKDKHQQKSIWKSSIAFFSGFINKAHEKEEPKKIDIEKQTEKKGWNYITNPHPDHMI